MELEVKTLILFFNEDKQIPFCKEKSLLKIIDDDIFRELNKFKCYVENYCGIQQSSAVKLARRVKDAKGVESFCINTQLQWDNERSKLADPCSMLQDTTTWKTRERKFLWLRKLRHRNGKKGLLIWKDTMFKNVFGYIQ
jgi:uncharacterized membrane protein